VRSSVYRRKTASEVHLAVSSDFLIVSAFAANRHRWTPNVFGKQTRGPCSGSGQSTATFRSNSLWNTHDSPLRPLRDMAIPWSKGPKEPTC